MARFGGGRRSAGAIADQGGSKNASPDHYPEEFHFLQKRSTAHVHCILEEVYVQVLAPGATYLHCRHPAVQLQAELLLVEFQLVHPF
jgi:hypothetical protein